MDADGLQSLLKCVECDSTSIALEAGSLHCGDCGRSWPSVNGIYDLRPRSRLPLPAMYRDPHFLRWQEELAGAQDYFYRGNRLIRWVQNAGHRAVARMSSSGPDAMTLDLACGDGAHRPFLSGTDNLVGLDIDQPSLEKLRSRFPDFLVVRGDCCRLPFADASFDRVISVASLEHLIHLDFGLEEVARILKPEGELLASVPAEGGWAWKLGRALTTARRFTTRQFDYRRSNAIDHCNCIWQITKALSRHFSVEKRCLFPFRVPSFHLNLIVSWRLRKR